MSISVNELQWRKAVEMSDASTNGGRMSHIAIPSNVKNNIFPNVPQAERTAGSTKYRKVFIHVANDSSLALIAPKLFMLKPTPGDDVVTLMAGTQTDTQSSLTGAEQQYGVGTLSQNVTAGGTSIKVLVESAAAGIFKSGMTIRISDRQSIDGAGNDQMLTLASDATYSGNVATLTTVTPLDYSFSTATPTYVSSVLRPADVQASVSDVSVSSANGTFAPEALTAHGVGSVEQQWTLTVGANGSAFTVTGSTLGNVGTGSMGSAFVPANPNFAKPYFTLNGASAFGGTFTAGDTITWRTAPAAIPVWYKRVTPPGASSMSGNHITVGVEGESE